jgi:hypothetical protein
MRIDTMMRNIPLALLLLCATAMVLRCGEAGSTGPQSCEEIGDQATASAANQDEPAFKIISPNGGEVYAVGDSITVRLGANARGTSALVYLVVKSGGRTKRLRMPGTPDSRDLNPRTSCEVSFRIPPAIRESGLENSLVSDEVKVRVGAYNNETLFFDESDGFFRITP